MAINLHMCTAASFKSGSFCFGRTLDNDKSYGEEVVISPRGFKLWRGGSALFAIMGMATVIDGLPLYYDGMNEKGLCMAGLNFEGNAAYNAPVRGRLNLAQCEFLPYILGTCATAAEAERAIVNINLTAEPFSKDIPPAPLHWMISDRDRDIVVECMGGRIQVHQNPVGVLTNNPPFPFHQMNLNRYQGLSPLPAQNRFCSTAPFQVFGQGMGAIGLPGDASPTSRYVKAAFHKLNSPEGTTEEEQVSQFFHLLDSVSMVRGSVVTPEGRCDITTYSCCVSAGEGIYYYKTYENSRISAVRLFGEELDTRELKIFPLREKTDIRFEN